MTIFFTLVDNFAIDFIDRERFNTIIGLTFLVVLLFSPDGLVGLWRKAVSYVHLWQSKRGGKNPAGISIAPTAES